MPDTEKGISLDPLVATGMGSGFIQGNGFRQVVLFAFKLAKLKIDLVFEFGIFCIREQLVKLLSGLSNVARVFQPCYLSDVEARVELNFKTRMCAYALAIVIVGFRVESQFLIHLANDEV